MAGSGASESSTKDRGACSIDDGASTGLAGWLLARALPLPLSVTGSGDRAGLDDAGRERAGMRSMMRGIVAPAGTAADPSVDSTRGGDEEADLARLGEGIWPQDERLRRLPLSLVFSAPEEEDVVVALPPRAGKESALGPSTGVRGVRAPEVTTDEPAEVKPGVVPVARPAVRRVIAMCWTASRKRSSSVGPRPSISTS